MRGFVLALTTLMLCLLAACSATSGVPEPTPLSESIPHPAAPLTLTVLHTNDTWGYLSPCG